MPDYKTMYFKLFAAVSDAIEILHNAQIETEELYISSPETKLVKLKPKEKNEKDN